MPVYHLNIGSNRGDRREIISRAVALIASLSAEPLRLSDFVESEPWGFSSPNMFLNIGVEIHTQLTPFRLLDELQEIERSLGATPHRTPEGEYCDRNLDIDIICCISPPMIVQTSRLQIPHPRMSQRGFVMRPLLQLTPDWQYPLTFNI